MARASALQAEGPGFESLCLQNRFLKSISEGTGRIIWSSEKGSKEDAWELPDDEGRG